MKEFDEITLKEYIEYLFTVESINKELMSIIPYLYNDDETVPDLTFETYFNNIHKKYDTEGFSDNFSYLIYSGTNDYREYNKDSPIFIPRQSQYGDEGVLGNGLYATPEKQVAIDYANATSTSLFSSGMGCAKNILIRQIGCNNIEDYNLCKGIILDEKKNYSEEEWNRYTRGKHFILNKTLDELVFISNMGGKIVYKNIEKIEPMDGLKSHCKKPFNIIKNVNVNEDELKRMYPHPCYTDDKPCPTTCEYLKATNQLPLTGENNNKIINCDTGEYESQSFKNKYLKYKMKYLELKKKISLN